MTPSEAQQGQPPRSMTLELQKANSPDHEVRKAALTNLFKRANEQVLGMVSEGFQLADRHDIAVTAWMRFSEDSAKKPPLKSRADFFSIMKTNVWQAESHFLRKQKGRKMEEKGGKRVELLEVEHLEEVALASGSPSDEECMTVWQEYLQFLRVVPNGKHLVEIAVLEHGKLADETAPKVWAETLNLAVGSYKRLRTQYNEAREEFIAKMKR